jgi:hypothetical protein
MPQNKPFRFGPVALTATYTTNIFNPGTTTGGVNSTSAPYDKLRAIIRKIRIVNKTAGAVTFRLYIGATGANAAGTEFLGFDRSIAANSAEDFYGIWPFDTTDFLVGGASALTSLVIEGEGEIGIA